MPVALKLVTPPEKEGRPKRQKEKNQEKDPFQTDVASVAVTEAPLVVGNNRKVLVVDDNPVVLKAFELKLKASGFAVITTSNAATVASTAEEEKIELIILDINFTAGGGMEWNGFTITQWLRRFPELAKIPIIYITGADTAKYKDKVAAAGGVAFFQKPVNYRELLNAVMQALSR